LANPPALLIRKKSVKKDPALKPGSRGARKHLVTGLYRVHPIKSLWRKVKMIL
jgi:hypothetical protein